MEDWKKTLKDGPDECSCEPPQVEVTCGPCGPADINDERLESTEEGNAAFSCRFCLHGTDNADELISPCNCSGRVFGEIDLQMLTDLIFSSHITLV
jgi:RING-variant domain